MTEIETKRCSRCKVDLVVSSFHKSRSRKDGLNPYCKICHSEYATNPKIKQAARESSLAYYYRNLESRHTYGKQYREENSDAWKAKNAAWRRANPDKVRAYNKARRALRLQAEVEVVDPTIVYLRDGWVCQICDKTVDPNLLGQSTSPAPSLDHKVPLSKGGEHSYSNTQLAHFGCNSRKRDLLWL